MDTNFKKEEIWYWSVRIRKNNVTRFEEFPNEISKISGAKIVGIEVLKKNPKLQWEDDVDQDMRILEVKNWKKVALDRDQWAKLLKKARAHQVLSSQ